MERWAVMEWIIVGSRLRLLALLLAVLAIAFGVMLLYVDGVSHLSRGQLRVFVQRRYEEQEPRSITGPLFFRLHKTPGR